MIGSPSVRSRFDQLRVRSRYVLDTDFRRASLEAVGGQPHVFARTAPGVALDSYGEEYAVGVGRPAWSITGGDTGLLTVPGDELYYRVPSRLKELSGIVTMRDQGALGESGTVLARIGLGDPGWVLSVGSTRTVVATLRNDAGTASTATSTTNIAAVGQALRLWWGVEFVAGNMRALLRWRVDDGVWSAPVTGSQVARDIDVWGVESGEGFARYYVSEDQS
jgi:hypothetical protein